MNPSQASSNASEPGDTPGSTFDATAAPQSPESAMTRAIVLGAIGDPCFRIDADSCFAWGNPSALALLERHVDPVIGASAVAVFPDAFGAHFDLSLHRAQRTGQATRFEDQYLPADTWLEVHLYPDAQGVTVLVHDASDRRRGSQLLEDQTRLLERIARGTPTKRVLDAVTGLVERHATGTISAVFAVQSAGGRLSLESAPGFPPEYAAELTPVDLSEDASPVARTALTSKPTTITDILTEPATAPYRASALGNGFRAIWTTPLSSSDSKLLGVLGLWRREPGPPTATEAELLRAATLLAGLALERRQAEIDLRQKEQEYRAIFETVQDGLLVTDARGFVAEANPAACRLHHSTRADLVGRSAADLVRPDYHGLLRRLLDDVRQGREFHGELFCTRRDGSSFPAELTAITLDFKGQRHVLALVRDISARKGMEDDLRRSEERLRTVAKGAPLVLFSLDKSGVFTLSEGQALAALGLRPGEVVGKSALELYAGQPDIVENLKLVLAGEPRRWIAEVGERVFHTTARPIRSMRGEIIGASGVGIDVTEQTMTVDALRESEERFRASFYQSPVPVAHANLDGRIFRASERLAELLGTTSESLVGQRVSQWYESAPPHIDDAAVLTLLAGETREVKAPRTLRTADGRQVDGTIGISLVRGRAGEPKHLTFVLWPI